jgi:hypothetical protein
VVEALEQRAAEHDAKATVCRSQWARDRYAGKDPGADLASRADECRRLARLLRHDDLPGCEAEDHP